MGEGGRNERRGRRGWGVGKRKQTKGVGEEEEERGWKKERTQGRKGKEREIDSASTITGVRKKIVSVTREARNVRFFWVSRSLFLDYKFKRFLQWLEFKWSFAKLKEEILIGDQCFSAVFC